MWWYTNHHHQKKLVPTAPPPVLDLAGKNSRKKPPLQKWQAFCSVYYSAKDSALRAEVTALFARRHDPNTVKFLTNFFPPDTDISTVDRLTFLGAFACERCTRLSSEEEEQVLAHIEKQQLLAAENRDRPWFLDDDYADKPS